MSHVSQIEIQIKSLDSLKAACARLGLQWCEGQKTYKWWGYWVGDYPLPKGFNKEDLGRCTHAIHVPGARFEIGVVERNGEINLLWDFYESGGLEEVLGKGGGLLKQAYIVEHAKATARRAGYRNIKEKRTLMDRVRGALGRQQVNGIRITIS